MQGKQTDELRVQPNDNVSDKRRIFLTLAVITGRLRNHLAESRTFCSFHTILLVPPRNYHFGENSRNIIFFVRNKQGEAKKRIETIMWINQRAEWENILNGTYKG